MLAALELSASELSILLTDDPGIHTLNLAHRGKDKPTDVLSFPQNEFRAPLVPKKRGTPLLLLGDVVISLDTAERQAKGRKRVLLEEIRFLLAHGILHLLGFDHGTPDEKKLMTAKTRWLVKASLG
jgi:probable rRNA maturation factor